MKTDYIQKNRITKNCQVCGKEFECAEYRKTIAKFCSKNCSYKGNPALIRDVPKICEECHKPYLAMRYRRYNGRFCSKKCGMVSSNRIAHAKKDVEKKCVVCNKLFMTTKWKSKTAKYCSKYCQHKAAYDRGLTPTNCTVCGKEIIREGRLGKRLRITRRYCSSICRSQGMSRSAPRTNKQPSVRKWFSRYNRMSKCERCGYCEHPKILVLHHKDRNRENNTMDNLETLCPNCHALEHLEEKLMGWQNAIKKRQQSVNNIH